MVSLILMHDIHMLNYKVADSVVLRKKKTSNYSVESWRSQFHGNKEQCQLMMIMSRRILIKMCSSSSNIAHSLKIFQSFQVCKPIFFRKLLQYEDIPRFWLCCQNIFVFFVCIFCCLNKNVCKLHLSQISLFVGTRDPAVFVAWTKDIPSPVLVLAPEQSSSCPHH